MRAASIVLVASCSICVGQQIVIGVKGGVVLTDDINSSGSSATSESKRYTIGPMLEIGLPFGFGFGVDALYRRQGYRTSFGNFAGSFSASERSNTWEFPLLLKYKLPFPILRPYAA